MWAFGTMIKYSADIWKPFSPVALGVCMTEMKPRARPVRMAPTIPLRNGWVWGGGGLQQVTRQAGMHADTGLIKVEHFLEWMHHVRKQ